MNKDTGNDAGKMAYSMYLAHTRKLLKEAKRDEEGLAEAIVKYAVENQKMELPFGEIEEWRAFYDGLALFLLGRADAYEAARFRLMQPFEHSCVTINFNYKVMKDGEVFQYCHFDVEDCLNFTGHEQYNELREQNRKLFAEHLKVPEQDVLVISAAEHAENVGPTSFVKKIHTD